MDVKARIAKLCDLLGKEFHPLSGITEDDRLVDLELGKSDIKKIQLKVRKIKDLFLRLVQIIQKGFNIIQLLKCSMKSLE